ncbi:MAG: AmmeMemoRadiSam system protein A [Chloroflexi bacterium]|nr:AmmeMemoRadiSam system protein A [Chloroflexota bacterium]MDA1145949.1 AmmeMemoRadiSam system protein A [Chloroflexota bacterium]
MLSEAHLDVLAQLAAETIVQVVRWGPAEPGPRSPLDRALWAPGISFVTLRQGSEERGCIGSLIPSLPLHRDVAENARKSALQDPRFKPLAAPELTETIVDVAVLTTPVPLSWSDEADLYRRLRPGVDGLVVRLGDTQAPFLPHVWARYPEPEEFVAQLRLKAAIDPVVPAAELSFERFTARHSRAVNLDLEVSRRRDIEATWWRWRRRLRPRQRLRSMVRSVGPAERAR